MRKCFHAFLFFPSIVAFFTTCRKVTLQDQRLLPCSVSHKFIITLHIVQQSSSDEDGAVDFMIKCVFVVVSHIASSSLLLWRDSALWRRCANVSAWSSSNGSGGGEWKEAFHWLSSSARRLEEEKGSAAAEQNGFNILLLNDSRWRDSLFNLNYSGNGGC